MCVYLIFCFSLSLFKYVSVPLCLWFSFFMFSLFVCLPVYLISSTVCFYLSSLCLSMYVNVMCLCMCFCFCFRLSVLVVVVVVCCCCLCVCVCVCFYLFLISLPASSSTLAQFHQLGARHKLQKARPFLFTFQNVVLYKNDQAF